MGIISNQLKKQYGIEVEELENEGQTDEQKENLRNYLKLVNTPVEKKEKKFIPYPILKKLFWQRCLHICSNTGKEFIVDSENIYFLKKICEYFSGDKNFLVDNKLVSNPSLDKGLFIYGSYGFGKSVSMLSMSKVLAGFKNGFAYKSTIEIVNDFERKVSMKKPAELNYAKGNYCFDDLGHEKRHFGNELFSDILFQRYDLFRNTGEKTHITSNKSCLLYTSPSPRDATLSRMPSSA